MSQTVGGLQNKAVQDAVALLPSTTDAVAHSVSQAKGTFLPRIVNGLMLELDVTAAAAAAGDTLDVFVQTMCDGVNFVDVAHFHQVLGNGGAKRYFDKIFTAGAQAEFENGTALAPGNVRNICGDQYRVRYTIADGGTHTQSFTFSVNVVPM
jgi:hypothetical protein